MIGIAEIRVLVWGRNRERAATCAHLTGPGAEDLFTAESCWAAPGPRTTG